MHQLIEDHGSRVQWLLTREFDPPLLDADVEDAYSSALQKTWNGIGGFDPARGKLAAWFYVICRNEALKVVLREKRQNRYVQLPSWDFVSALEDADDTLSPERRKFLEALDAAIDELPRRQREVLRADLAAGGQADAAELAKRLRTSSNTIYVSRSNGRKALKTKLEERGYFQSPAPEPELEGKNE